MSAISLYKNTGVNNSIKKIPDINTNGLPTPPSRFENFFSASKIVAPPVLFDEINKIHVQTASHAVPCQCKK